MGKANYKNWMPKGMIYAAGGASGAFLALYLAVRTTGIVSAGWRTALLRIALAGFAACGAASVWMTLMYRRFSYDGKRQLSRLIIEEIASHVDVPAGGEALDIGCGSGALTIACAKRSPDARFLGVDRWGVEYASFSKKLCEQNAAAEGVSNVSFAKGDALHLDFPDARFDAVVSNYVYHNIVGRDRQEILLETLRVLKKGGTFALHDIFSKAKYGDMQAFRQKLLDMGYQDVRLIPTTRGNPITPFEAIWMELAGSALLVGKK
ncbi:MAG: class I SAM-dependent methyltransferase [Oscillospiraceae bacterium]|nr:class I SAM-dependent methyltransferase [Oscillospiraceae bacterium]